MVSVKLCSYTEASDPEFLINISSSSSKHAGKLGDLLFHTNTIATDQNRPKSNDMLFSLVALGISQGVFQDDALCLFHNQEYGLHKLKTLGSNKGSYTLAIHNKYADAPVFISRQIVPRHPKSEVPHWPDMQLSHPSDKTAWGNHSCPMTAPALN